MSEKWWDGGNWDPFEVLLWKCVFLVALVVGAVAFGAWLL